jgi:DNA-binding FadR family transcriptional regulator
MARRHKALTRLHSLLTRDDYPAGSRLPPERKLCTELEVSRSALREALEVLEAEGAIWRQVGKGTYVGQRPIKTSGDLVAISTLTSPVDVMEVRLLVEPSIARLAALRATETDIAEMRRCARKNAAAKDAKTLELWDGLLHRALAQSVRNSLLLALFDGFNMVRGQTAWGRLGEAALTPERWKNYTGQHMAIVEAVADRDADLAERRMRHHLNTVRANLLSVAEGLSVGPAASAHDPPSLASTGSEPAE